MDPKAITELIRFTIWPLTTAILVFSFYSPLRTLLARLGESLSIKGVKLKVLGAELEIPMEEAKSTLNEMLQDILEPTEELSEKEQALFKAIKTGGGRKNVADLIPGFLREHKDELGMLRALRDRKL